uniref:Uncharacterized protein n=1 Tax=Mesocestoides corti TaxID=53468 RepID=A0A5K3FVG0_MESCO
MGTKRELVATQTIWQASGLYGMFLQLLWKRKKCFFCDFSTPNHTHAHALFTVIV